MSDTETTTENPEVEVPTGENPEAPTTDGEKTSSRQMAFVILDTGLIQASFGEGLEPVTLNPAEVPEAIQAAAVSEGLISRARGYTSKLTGDKRTPENLRLAIIKAFESLLAGVWKVERQEGLGGEYSIEAEAAYLFKVKRAAKKGETFAGTLAEVAEQFGGLSDEQKKTLKGLPLYQACYAEVKAARQTARAQKLAQAADEAEDNAPL